MINVPQFFEEMKKNEDKGLASCKGRVLVSDRAHIGKFLRTFVLTGM